MRLIGRRLKLTFLLMFLAFAAAGSIALVSTETVEAATNNGFVTTNGKTYYYVNGTKVKGWKTLNGKKYFFNKSTGVQVQGWLTYGGKKYYLYKSTTPSKRYAATGWMKDSSGNKRYFDSNGVMIAGKFYSISGKIYYFSPGTGIMKKNCWITSSKNKYYATSSGALYRNQLVYIKKYTTYRYFGKYGAMKRGWMEFDDGIRFFRTLSTTAKDGLMARGFLKISGKTYYFKSRNGYKLTGWLSLSGKKYYLDPDNDGVRVENTKKTIDGVTYSFSTDGVATEIDMTDDDPKTTASTGTKTIKNYLKGALLPVGQALYVWGGGWNDSTRKGVSPTWKQWYNSQSSSYDYNNYRDLSDGNRAKGLDCSGFVGWAAYQVMHTTSNVGDGYTVVASDVGSYYADLGWGTIVNQSKLSSTNYKIYPGDVGYNDGHTWIMLGQCSDKSCVIVHSTPQAGCQIAGTPTPDGDYTSEAIQLAEKYMSRYAGYTKYDYHTSSGNYVRNGNYLRWNRSTLSDPDGYLKMTAAQILYDLFGY